MKLHTSPRVPRCSGKHRGMTLLEMTVVIMMLLALISILFIGARAWLKGSDRATCILSIRNVQMATRVYQNTYGYDYGSRPAEEYGGSDIAEHLFSRGFIEQRAYDEIEGNRPCPGGGIYNCPIPDVFPPLGSLYVECSLAELAQHVPSAPGSW